jgi:hypothetical protein
MPDRDERTLRDLIWHQYAKIVARRAHGLEHLFGEKSTTRKRAGGKHDED